MSTESASLVGDLASETIDWMAEDRGREDVADYVWAFSLATFVDGRCHPEAAVTPRGYDVSHKFGPGRCSECFLELTDEPAGSTLCARCFFGIDDKELPEPNWLQRLGSRIAALWDTGKDRSGGDER